MAHATGARTGGSSLATLSVEGRACAAHPIGASAVGTASGLAVVADSAQAARDATRWMPGRILVLTERGLTACVEDGVLADLARWGFAAVVLLVAEDPVVPAAWPHLPIVVVRRSQDQEQVRRAVRISVEVVDAPGTDSAIPHPRHRRRRQRLAPWLSREGAHRVPGTIDLRQR